MSDEKQESLKNNAQAEHDVKIHKGGCHCRKFEFEYAYRSFETHPPATCNCSYCTIQGGILINTDEADNAPKWIKGSLEETAMYKWNSKQFVWSFCPMCGVILLWNGFGKIGINARCLDDVTEADFEKVKMIKFDGATQVPGDSPAKQQKAVHKEPASLLSPQANSSQAAADVDPAALPEFHESGTEVVTHLGGCHCRKFEFEYDYPYFDVHAPTYCNCSYCYMQSVVLAYGKDENKPLRWTKGSLEEATKYKWNSNEITWHFCPDCGSLLLWNLDGKSHNVVGEMGVNARCFNEFGTVDLDKLTLRKSDGANEIPGVPPAKRQQQAQADA